MGWIYGLADPISDVDKYIGCTTQPLKVRFRGHINEKRRHRKATWIKSLKTKGLLPKLNIIDEVPNNEIYFWEMYYISLYRSWGFDLVNSTLGGKSSYGYKKTKKDILNHLLGNATHKKQILQYDKNGDFIREWNGIVTASKKLKLSASQISNNIKGYCRSCGGFFWKLKTDDFSIKIKIPEIKQNPKSIPVLQYDLNGNFIKKWNNTTDAKFYLTGKKSNQTTIVDVLHGRQNTSMGYVWKKYNGGEINKKIEVNIEPKISWKHGKKSKAVLQFDLKDNFLKEWYSASQAQSELHISAHDIRSVCKGHHVICKGYKWKYKN